MTTTLKPETRNITRVFRLATDGDRAAGHGWYARARDLAERLADQYDMPMPDEREAAIEKAAGVIASLSPMLAWRKNVEYAELAYLTYAQMQQEASLRGLTEEVREAIFAGVIPCLKSNARKAYRILNGEHPEEVLGGPKVRAFYFTIANPFDPRAVVIDRHAAAIAVNKPLVDAEIGKLLGRKAAYDSLSELYRRAARIISRELRETWTPAQVQAVTWTYWRRERAAAYHGEA